MKLIGERSIVVRKGLSPQASKFLSDYCSEICLRRNFVFFDSVGAWVARHLREAAMAAHRSVAAWAAAPMTAMTDGVDP